MSKRFYWKKIRPILISVTICCVFFLVLIAVINNRVGNLTIFVDRTSVTKSLSLSESSRLTNPKGKILGPSINNAWDTTEELIPDNVNMYDGNTSKNNYIAYTFYVFNSGTEKFDYSMKLELESCGNNLDEAIRVKLYVDDVPTTYAKKNSITGVPEANTVAFESSNIIATGTITDLEPNEAVKYTIVVWVEGEDTDCTNDKIGGYATLSMAFSVIGVL